MSVAGSRTGPDAAALPAMTHLNDVAVGFALLAVVVLALTGCGGGKY